MQTEVPLCMRKKIYGLNTVVLITTIITIITVITNISITINATFISSIIMFWVLWYLGYCTMFSTSRAQTATDGLVSARDQDLGSPQIYQKKESGT